VSRTKSFIYNSLTAALLQIFTFIAGFIVPRIILAFYGSEINGLVTSITQFIAYFNLVEAGLAGAAVYALYKPLADEDHKSINAVLSATNRFYILSGYIFVALTLGLALIYPAFVKTTELSPFSVGALVLILGVSGALEFFTMAKYRVLLTADQKLYVLSLASIVAIVLNTVIIAVMAYSGASIVILRFVALFSVFARSLILYIYVRLNYKYIDYKETPNNEALNKRWDALYLQILGAIHTGAPVIIATIFTSLQMVSVYSIFHMVVAGVSGIVSIFTSGLSASFGDVIARNEQSILQKAYQEFELMFYALISWAFSCTMVLIMPFIKLYTAGINDVNYNIPLIGFLFTLNGLLFSLKTPQGMLVISAGLFRETRLQVTIQGLIAVVGGVIFVQFLGLAGILIGSILSNIYRDIDLLFYIPHIEPSPRT
jgi:O-antigen/teichoic acid export membrane protein